MNRKFLISPEFSSIISIIAIFLIVIDVLFLESNIVILLFLDLVLFLNFIWGIVNISRLLNKN